MADSDTTQQVDIKKLLAKADAIIAKMQKRAERKALAEAKQDEREAKREAIIANSQAEREAKREAHEKLLAEARAIIANSQAEREAHKKLLAEARAIFANSQAEREALAEAEPFLTTSQWLSAIFIAASLAGF